MTLQAEWTNLSAGYGRSPVLSDITLSLTGQECVALVGPNGSGKSTLLRTIAGLIRPTAGKVTIDGRSHWSASERARLVAYCRADEATEWPLTVDQSVLLGRTPHRGWVAPFTADDRRIVDDILAKCGLTHLRQRMVNQLSDGERQRVALARSLAQQPRILLLDEPTANLDLKYQVELLAMVKGWAECGLAVVAAIHDLTLAAGWADRVVMLKEGRIVAMGTVDECFTSEQIAATYDVPVTVARVNNRLVIVPGA